MKSRSWKSKFSRCSTSVVVDDRHRDGLRRVTAEELGPASRFGVVGAGDCTAVARPVEHAHVCGDGLAQCDGEVHLAVGLPGFDVGDRCSRVLADLFVVVDRADSGGLDGRRPLVPIQAVHPVDVGVELHRLAAVLDVVVDDPHVHRLRGLVVFEPEVGDALPPTEVVVRVRRIARHVDPAAVVLALDGRAVAGAQRHLDPVPRSGRRIDRDVELEHVRVADVSLPAARGVLVPLVRRGVADLQPVAFVDHLGLAERRPQAGTDPVDGPHLERIGGVGPRVRHVQLEAVGLAPAGNVGPLVVGAALELTPPVLVGRDRVGSHGLRLGPEHRDNRSIGSYVVGDEPDRCARLGRRQRYHHRLAVVQRRVRAPGPFVERCVGIRCGFCEIDRSDVQRPVSEGALFAERVVDPQEQLPRSFEDRHDDLVHFQCLPLVAERRTAQASDGRCGVVPRSVPERLDGHCRLPDHRLGVGDPGSLHQYREQRYCAGRRPPAPRRPSVRHPSGVDSPGPLSCFHVGFLLLSRLRGASRVDRVIPCCRALPAPPAPDLSCLRCLARASPTDTVSSAGRAAAASRAGPPPLRVVPCTFSKAGLATGGSVFSDRVSTCSLSETRLATLVESRRVATIRTRDRTAMRSVMFRQRRLSPCARLRVSGAGASRHHCTVARPRTRCSVPADLSCSLARFNRVLRTWLSSVGRSAGDAPGSRGPAPSHLLHEVDRRPQSVGVPRRPVVAGRQSRHSCVPSHGNEADREAF